MISVGETLRSERLRRNLSLDQISQELKISSKFLEAIEEEKFDRLPGGVFAKSFVRQYARLLGLDEEELAAEVQHALQPAPAHPQFAEPSRQPAAEIRLPRVEQWEGVPQNRVSWSSWLPALAGVVVVMLVCSLVYSWWQRTRASVSAHEENAAPAQMAETTPPVAEPSAVPPQAAPGSQPSAVAAESPAAATPKPAEPSPVAGSVAPLQTQPAASPRVTASNPNASVPNASVRVEVTAGEPVWVLARSDGKYSFSGTLETNQTRVIEGHDAVLLRLGNAGGVTVTLNGKPLGAMGPKGQVRTLQFTPGGFQTVAAPKPSLPPDDIL